MAALQFVHNCSTCDSPASSEPNGSNSNSRSFTSSSVSNRSTHSQSIGLTATDSPTESFAAADTQQKVKNINLTEDDDQRTSTLQTMSSTFPPLDHRQSQTSPTTTSSLDKASQLLASCKNSLIDINSIHSNVLTSSPRKSYTCLDSTNQLISGKTNISNQSSSDGKLDETSASTDETKIIDDIDASIFDDDDGVEFIEDIEPPTPPIKLPPPRMVENHFFDNICSDLLQSADKGTLDVQRGKNKFYGRGVKRMRRSLDYDESTVISPSKKPLFEGKQRMLEGKEHDEARIKKLLKEKEAMIEEKRKNALNKRWQSLQRSISK